MRPLRTFLLLDFVIINDLFLFQSKNLVDLVDVERQDVNIQDEANAEKNNQQNNQAQNLGFKGSDVSLPSENPSSQDYASISDESGSNTTTKLGTERKTVINTRRRPLNRHRFYDSSDESQSTVEHWHTNVTIYSPGSCDSHTSDDTSVTSLPFTVPQQQLSSNRHGTVQRTQPDNEADDTISVYL